MPLPPDAEAWLRIALTPGLTAESFRRLLSVFGTPEDVLRAGPSSLARIIPARMAQALASGPPADRLAQARVWLQNAGHHIVTLADEAYPKSLLETHDPPPLLYVVGRLDLLNVPAIAVVGSRSATAQGSATAESFARALSDAGLAVVSGLALGIDAAAHRGGLAGLSSSIAVVGTGLDVVYPARNRDLARDLARRGALVSEFPLGTAPIASNFPRRNRVLSGLARGCLVVEAAIESGSLITARLAAEQGKDVFAIPGSIHSPQSRGCHALIKQGAKLTESAADILDELGLGQLAASPPSAPAAADASGLLEFAGFDPFDIDTLTARSGRSTEDVIASITQFEIEGRIAPLPGGKYQRLR